MSPGSHPSQWRPTPDHNSSPAKISAAPPATVNLPKSCMAQFIPKTVKAIAAKERKERKERASFEEAFHGINGHVKVRLFIHLRNKSQRHYRVPEDKPSTNTCKHWV